ncbi:MAG: sugar transferase [Chloroflexi bacterium]|nr:sugar transferase [Chloroflexota bacterium]
MFGKLRRVVLALAVCDAIATQAALVTADFARRTLPFGQPLAPSVPLLNPPLHLIVFLLWPAIFVALSVYDVRRDTRPVGEARTLVMAVGTAGLVFAGALYFSFRDLPRLLVVYFVLFDLALLAWVRLTVGLGLELLRGRGQPLSRVLIVGAGEAATMAAEVLSSHLRGIEVVGCADSRAKVGPKGLPVLGTLADVPRLVLERGIDDVIIALPSEAYLQVEALAYALQPLPVRVRLVPDFLKLVVVQSSVESLGGLPLIGLREPRIDGPAWIVKRLFDVTLTIVGLIFLWPVLALIAIAIRLDTPGLAIFTQTRVGENGRIFKMYKFRTMVADAERLGPPVGFDDRGRRVYKTPDDTRVTRMGRFLRRTSLDELPQLFNVLKGEMSLVGPRPEMQFIVEGYEPWQRGRLAVPPGITGWWQVSGRSNLPMHLNTQYDLYYIRNYSLWLDLMILWKTVGVVIRGQGAY